MTVVVPVPPGVSETVGVVKAVVNSLDEDETNTDPENPLRLARVRTDEPLPVELIVI